jgi:hypothetical protein|eukprot:COSAG02_NODE_30_length_50867_cov_66.594331_14_plen_105_part_00
MGCTVSRDVNQEWNRPRKSDKREKSPRLVHFAEGTKGGPSAKPRLARTQTGLGLAEMVAQDDEESVGEETLEFDLPGTASPHPAATGGNGTPHPRAEANAGTPA